MQRYQNVAQDALGNIVQGMNATVFLTGTQTLASLFSNAAGTLPIANPVQTDALGNFAFYAANGRYDVQLSRSGLPTTILSDILMFDPFGGGGGALAPAQILFGGPANAIAQDPNFFWDNVNERLNVGAGGAALDTRLILNGGTNAVKGALINFQRGGSSQGFFGTSDLILGDAAGNLAIQCVADLKIARGNSTIPSFNTTSSGVAVNGASTGTFTLNGGMSQNYDSAGVNPLIQADTNAAGATWITGPGSGSGSRGDYNIFNSTANQLVLRFNKTTGAAAFLSSVTTPQIQATGAASNFPGVANSGLAGLNISGTPVAALINAGQTANNRVWDFIVTGATLQARASADDLSSANAWLTVTRSGTSVSAISLSNTGVGNITLNSNGHIVDLSGDNLHDIGIAGDRWRNGQFGTSVTTPSVLNATGVAINGTNTNDNAAAGNYGEYVEAAVGSVSAVALTTNTAANVTSITLGAGDWDVRGTILYKFAATTSYTRLQSNVSQTSVTPDGISGHSVDFETAATVPNPAATDPSQGIPPARFSLSGSTTIFLIALATFTVSTLSAYGRISARRVR